MSHTSSPVFSSMISTCFILFLIINSCSAYYTVFLREIGPEWFSSFHYFMTSTNLHARNPSPTACYEMPLSSHKDTLKALGMYNKLGETPPTALAVYPYLNPSCGEVTALGAAIDPPGPPSFVIVPDQNDLYGLFVVDVQKLGLKWYRGQIRALNATAERIDPKGLLYGVPEHAGNSLYVWEGDEDTEFKAPVRRAYIPNAVDKVEEPRDFLQTMNLESGRYGYIYMRDLMERHLRRELKDLPDNITPWFEKNNAGEFDKMKKKPVLHGPWYDREQASRKTTNRFAWQDVKKNVPQSETKVDKGWTLVYSELDENTVPGMEYYDLENLPAGSEERDVINASQPDIEESESDASASGEYGRLLDQKYSEKESAEDAYVFLPDGADDGNEATDGVIRDTAEIPQSVFRMRRVHGARRIEEEERDLKSTDPNVESFSTSANDRTEVIFPSQNLATAVKMEEEEIARERRPYRSTVASGSQPNPENQYLADNMILGAVQRLRGMEPIPQDLSALSTAQQEGFTQRNEIFQDLDPFRRTAAAGNRHLEVPNMSDLVEDPVTGQRAPTTSRSRIRQSESRNAQEEYEDWYDPLGRNTRLRDG